MGELRLCLFIFAEARNENLSSKVNKHRNLANTMIRKIGVRVRRRSTRWVMAEQFRAFDAGDDAAAHDASVSKLVAAYRAGKEKIDPDDIAVFFLELADYDGLWSQANGPNVIVDV